MKQRKGRDAPLYSEAQATAWLAWLARGMTAHGQTVFLIEQLQPSWLSTRTQRWSYLVTTRLLWGVASGLIFGLLVGLIFDLLEATFRGLSSGFSGALVSGLIFGLAGGLIDVVRSGRQRLPPESNSSRAQLQIIWRVLAFGLIFGLIGGLIGGLWTGPAGGLKIAVGYGSRRVVLASGLLYALIGGVVGGLVGWIIGGLFWVLRNVDRDVWNEIRTVETIRFSWAHYSKGFIIGLIAGLMTGLVSGLIGILLVDVSLGGLVGGLVFGAVGGLIFGLISGLTFGLINCFQPGIRELKTVPNQGIWLSLRSACLIGGIGGLGFGLLAVVWAGWEYGLICGALTGLCIGLWYGGLDVIQHTIVRLLLVRQGVMPWNYARFLDYAAEELNFLQKVGGGYMFVHRYLLEYFAAIEQPKPGPPVEGRDVAQPAVDTAG